MRLVHLSVLGIVGCLIGLAALAAGSLLAFEQVRDRQAEMHTLLTLSARIDNISAASDQLLLHAPDAPLWNAYRAEARDIEQQLEQIGEFSPDARRAARQMNHLLAAMESVHARVEGDAGAGVGPLEVPLRARSIMNQIAGHGVALDTALDGAIAKREAAITREVRWITGSLAAAALLFGLLCVITFGLIHRRVKGPVRALTKAMDRVRAGNRDVRVPVRGGDEFADLGRAFNDMLDDHRETGERLQQYRRLVEGSTDFFCVIDATYHYTMCNQAYAELFCLEPEEIEGAFLPDVRGETFFAQEAKGPIDRCLGGETIAFEGERVYPSIGKRHMLIRYYPIPSADGVIRHVGSVATDLTASKIAQEELRRSRNELQHALETRQALIGSLPAHIALLDPAGTVIDVNERWRQFAETQQFAGDDAGVGSNYIEVCRRADGDCAEEAIEVADGLEDILTGKREQFSLEYPCHSPDTWRWFRMTANRIDAGTFEAGRFGAVVMHVDVTERKLAERELNRLAFEDPTTGALTRHGFVAAVNERIERHGWQADAHVVILDLEAHRNVNDAHGYDTGDRVLAEVRKRLQEASGDDGIVGRIGGDEFVTYLPAHDRNGNNDPQRIAQAFDRPIDVDAARIEVNARFGLTRLGAEQRSPQTLLHEAELALFEARGPGNMPWSTYTTELDRAAHQRMDLTQDLRRALEEQEFELYFHPKVDLASGELLACEALLRWNHPERGLQPPNLFIPIAEQSQLIGPIGEWALFEACRNLAAWREAGLDVVRVAVNVSVVQFRLGNFTQRIREALATYQVDPASLTLEITESVFEDESAELRRQMREIHALGVHLSLDDFGTGYSSLLYLQQYPFDEIKIDQGFVRHLLDDPYSRNIVNTVLGIVGALGAQAVAEGVETAAVRDALLEMGCRVGQGYYYSMPLAVEDFTWLLKQRQPLPLVAATAYGGHRCS